jgi:GntR family transcriptional regulator
MNISFPTQLQKQFEDSLRRQTLPKGGRYTPGELAEQFQASTADMEAVLLAEARKGLVYPSGEGWQILDLSKEGLDSLFQHTSRAGLKPASNVRAAVIEPASEAAASRLSLPAGAPVYRLERTRIINGEVLANQVNYLPYEVSPGLENDDLSQYSFQKLLEDRYCTIITEIREDMRIEPGSAKDTEILGLPADSPVLVIERLSFSPSHLPVVWADIHIRTDRYHYVASLWPNASQILGEHGLNT